MEFWIGFGTGALATVIGLAVVGSLWLMATEPDL